MLRAMAKSGQLSETRQGNRKCLLIDDRENRKEQDASKGAKYFQTLSRVA